MNRVTLALAALLASAASAGPLDVKVLDRWVTFRTALTKKVSDTPREARMGKILELRKAALAEAKLEEADADAIDTIYRAIDSEKDPKVAEMYAQLKAQRAQMEQNLAKVPEQQRQMMAQLLAKAEVLTVPECKARWGEAIVKAAEARYPEYAKKKAEAMEGMGGPSGMMGPPPGAPPAKK